MIDLKMIMFIAEINNQVNWLINSCDILKWYNNSRIDYDRDSDSINEQLEEEKLYKYTNETINESSFLLNAFKKILILEVF